MGTTRNVSWTDLSPTRRKAIVVGGAAELVVTTVAAIDLYRRDASQASTS